MKEYYKKIVLINGFNVIFYEIVLFDYKCKYDIKFKLDKESVEKYVLLVLKLLWFICLVFCGKLKVILIIIYD